MILFPFRCDWPIYRRSWYKYVPRLHRRSRWCKGRRSISRQEALPVLRWCNPRSRRMCNRIHPVRLYWDLFLPRKILPSLSEFRVRLDNVYVFLHRCRKYLFRPIRSIFYLLLRNRVVLSARSIRLVWNSWRNNILFPTLYLRSVLPSFVCLCSPMNRKGLPCPEFSPFCKYLSNRCRGRVHSWSLLLCLLPPGNCFFRCWVRVCCRHRTQCVHLFRYSLRRWKVQRSIHRENRA